MKTLIVGTYYLVLSGLLALISLAGGFVMSLVSAIIGALFLKIVLDMFSDQFKAFIPLPIIEIAYWDAVWLCFVCGILFQSRTVPDISVKKQR